MEPTRKARAKHRAPTLRMLISSQSKLAQARIASNNCKQHRIAVI